MECFSVYAFMKFYCSLQFGSAVKLPGSGGAVVGLCLDEEKLVRLHYVRLEPHIYFLRLGSLCTPLDMCNLKPLLTLQKKAVSILHNAHP